MGSHAGSIPKLLSLADAAETVRDVQARGQTVVLCHGCFDIVHPGHVRHLKEAARFGDRLMVSITGDAAVDKGEGRPLIPQELRAENLAALDCVDHVVISPRPTAVELLERVRPDVYIKGREYEHSADRRWRAERHAVESYGGRVVFSSGDVVFSSTSLISAIEASVAPARAELRQLLARHALNAHAMNELLGRFAGRRVLVVGETIVDTYVVCDRPQVAGESPVMTLRPLEYRSFDGGAAIIAHHVAALGGHPTLVTPLPPDERGRAMRQRLEDAGIDVGAVGLARPVIEKQRFLVGTQKVMKVDHGESLTLDAAQQSTLIGLATDAARACDAVIVADFGEGLFSAPLIGTLCEAVRPEVDLLVGDVSGERSGLLAFRHADVLCPSEAELRAAVHDYEDGLTSVVWSALQQTRSQAALVTLGDEGLIGFECRGDAHEAYGQWKNRLDAAHVPSLAPYALDALGCGDALLATATMTLAAGGSLLGAAVLGSVAAAAQAQRLGNATIGMTDVRRGVDRLFDGQLTVTPGTAPHGVVECTPGPAPSRVVSIEAIEAARRTATS